MRWVSGSFGRGILVSAIITIPDTIRSKLFRFCQSWLNAESAYIASLECAAKFLSVSPDIR
ncbi:MAG: hypothetical protein ACOYD7_01080 [Raoultibacter sp.]